MSAVEQQECHITEGAVEGCGVCPDCLEWEKGNVVSLKDRLAKHKVQPTWAERMRAGEAQPTHQVVIPGPSFDFVAVGDLEYSEPEFLVDGLIETDSLASVFGDPGHGKSFAAIDLACCVATGTPFHGREVRQGSVFYIAGEGHNGLARRFNAWAKHLDTELKGQPLFTSKRAANFLDAAHTESVAKAVSQLAEVYGSPQMIVVDTLARSFGDGDENSTADMNKFVAAMDDLRGRYPGAVVLVVHHTGHAEKGRSRGSMAFKGALDSEYQVAKTDNVITITCKKMKEGEEPAPLSFKLEGIELGVDKKGESFGSAVLVPCDAPATGGAGRLSSGKQLALETFEMAALETGTKKDGSYRGVALADWREVYYQKSSAENIDTKRRNFNRVRGQLVEAGFLIVNNDLYQVGGNYPLDTGNLL